MACEQASVRSERLLAQPVTDPLIRLGAQAVLRDEVPDSDRPHPLSLARSRAMGFTRLREAHGDGPGGRPRAGWEETPSVG